MTVKKPESLLKRIADHVGVNQRTVRRWRELEDYPGDDVGFDALIAWVDAKGLGLHKNTDSLTALRADVEREKLRKLRRENEVAEGRIIPVETMNTINGELAAKLALLLKVKFVTELPSLCVGNSISEIRAVAQQKIDEISDVTTKGLLDWESGRK